MRLILFTGKGGVGKSSIASATAALSARQGKRTLLVSSDLAHNLSDIFEETLADGRKRVTDRLTLLEVDVLHEIRENWSSVQEYFAGFLAYLGLEDAVAEEVSLIPGMDEIFLLARILREVESKAFDTVIVDCSPTAGTLKLLTFSDSSSTKLNKMVEVERKILKLVRPLTRPIRSMRAILPDDATYESFGELIRYIGRLGDLLKDPDTSSVRLVLNPDRIAVAETRRAYTYFQLFGFPVDAVMVNKVFPEEVSNGYFKNWWELQEEELRKIEASFLDCPIFKIPYLDHEPLGLAQLEKMGEGIYGERRPGEILFRKETVRLDKVDGKMALVFTLPNLDRSSLDIGQRGTDLLITAGHYTRVFTLPDSLAAAEVAGAAFEGDRLTITFQPAN